MAWRTLNGDVVTITTTGLELAEFFTEKHCGENQGKGAIFQDSCLISDSIETARKELASSGAKERPKISTLASNILAKT